MKILIDDKEIKEIKIPSLPLPHVDEDGNISIANIIKEKDRGRNGAGNLTQLEKEIIAKDAIETGLSQNDLAKVHGVSREAVSYISKGYDRTNVEDRKVNEGVKEVIENSREKIANIATEKLLKTLEHFIPETLDMKDKPGAAVKLASVIEKVSQGFNGEGSNRPQFIVFSPRVRNEREFDVIDVSASEVN